MAKHLDSLSRTVAPSQTETPVSPPAETVEKTPTSPVISSPMEDKDSYESLFPEPSVRIGSPPKWMWWLLLILAAVLVGIVTYKVINNKIDTWLTVAPASSTPTPLATPTPSIIVSSPTTNTTPTAAPTAAATPTTSTTPTPSGSIDKSAISLRVLNGTTVNGAASTVKTTLQKAGFTVRTIGNAKLQNYTTTIIYYQSGHLAEAQAVGAALTGYTPTYTEDSTIAAPDMVAVVIGAQ